MSIAYTILTKAGADAINRAKSNRSTLDFTRMCAGDGNPVSGHANLTRLVSPKAYGALSRKKYISPITVSVWCDLASTDIPETFDMYELGLFCADPDDATKEVLFLYGCVAMGNGNEVSVIETIDGTGEAVKRFFSFKINLFSEAARPVRATYSEKVLIEDFKALKGASGWLKNIVTLPEGAYEKSLSGLIKSNYDSTADVSARFVSNILKVANGGIGGNTPAAAIANLGITAASIGAALLGHTHNFNPGGASGTAPGFMSASDKVKLDAIFEHKFGRWIPGRVSLPGAGSGAYKLICTDGLNVYLPRADGINMDIVNIATKEITTTTFGTGSTPFACCTDWVNVYIVISSGLIKYNIAAGTYSPLPFTNFTAYDISSCCTDGMYVHISNASKLCTVTVSNGNVTSHFIPSTTGPGEIFTDGSHVFRLAVADGGGTSLYRYNISDSSEETIHVSASCSVGCSDFSNVYMAGPSAFVTYNISTGSLVYGAAEGNPLSCRIDAGHVLVTTDGLLMTRYSTADGIKDRDIIQRAVYWSQMPVVSDGVIYALDYTGTTWGLFFMSRYEGWTGNGFGPKMLTFPVYACDGVDPVVFPEAFSDRCVYATAINIEEGKVAPASISDSGATFNVNADKEYMGIAIGY